LPPPRAACGRSRRARTPPPLRQASRDRHARALPRHRQRRAPDAAPGWTGAPRPQPPQLAHPTAQGWPGPPTQGRRTAAPTPARSHRCAYAWTSKSSSPKSRPWRRHLSHCRQLRRRPAPDTAEADRGPPCATHRSPHPHARALSRASPAQSNHRPEAWHKSLPCLEPVIRKQLLSSLPSPGHAASLAPSALCCLRDPRE